MLYRNTGHPSAQHTRHTVQPTQTHTTVHTTHTVCTLARCRSTRAQQCATQGPRVLCVLTRPLACTATTGVCTSSHQQPSPSSTAGLVFRHAGAAQTPTLTPLAPHMTWCADLLTCMALSAQSLCFCSILTEQEEEMWVAVRKALAPAYTPAANKQKRVSGVPAGSGAPAAPLLLGHQQASHHAVCSAEGLTAHLSTLCKPLTQTSLLPCQPVPYWPLPL